MADRYSLYPPSRWRQIGDSTTYAAAVVCFAIAYMLRLPGHIVAWPIAALGKWLNADNPHILRPQQRITTP